MTTILRKLMVLLGIVAVLGLANIHQVTHWLVRHGVPEAAEHIERHYLTGTTVAVVIALLLLLRSERPRYRRHLPPWEPPVDPIDYDLPSDDRPLRPRRYRER